MKRVLYLSSWQLFKESKIEIPFIYEQIGVLSKDVRATYVEPIFYNFKTWLKLYYKNDWVIKKPSPWKDDAIQVDYFQIYLPKISTRITNNSLIDDLFYASYFLSKQIQKKIGKVDIIHLNAILPLGGFAVGWYRRLNTPFILHEHSAPFEMHLDNKHKRRWVVEILDKASRIVAVGSGLLKRIQDTNPRVLNKMVVIPNMIRTDLFQVSDNNLGDTVNLISVGGLVERKGYDLLLNAVSALIDQKYKVQLCIVGEGESRLRLEEMIHKLNLGKIVTLTGYLNKKEINSLFHKSNIYVHTSYRETFGIAPTEAMLKGRPVVSTICEGPEYYINKENGVLVETGNAVAVAEGIKFVIKNFEKYNVHKIRSTVVDLFGEKKFLKSMIQVYEGVKK
ncbi:hypothetical protein MASR2M41_13960 [Flammeovirgaceae bacterium]